MKLVSLSSLALVAIFVGSLSIAGCSSSSAGDDTTVKEGSGQITNPSGKPQNEADSARASQMQSQGQQMSAAASNDAKAMQEAMKRTGGK